jgi:hypothetical protein
VDSLFVASALKVKLGDQLFDFWPVSYCWHSSFVWAAQQVQKKFSLPWTALPSVSRQVLGPEEESWYLVDIYRSENSCRALELLVCV